MGPHFFQQISQHQLNIRLVFTLLYTSVQANTSPYNCTAIEYFYDAFLISFFFLFVKGLITYSTDVVVSPVKHNLKTFFFFFF